MIEYAHEHDLLNVDDAEVCNGFSAAELAQIADEVRQRGPDDLHNKHAGTHRVDMAGQRYKVRSYTTRQEARKQYELLQRVSGMFVPCCGRVGRFVILKHVPVESLETTPKPLSRVATFLAELAAVRTSPVSSQEFGDWCCQLEAAGIFRRQALKQFQDYYRDQLANPIRWCLQLYDAKPANFVVGEDRECICVDEKHLLKGPCGLSLIRPLRKFASADYRRLANEYCAKTENDSFANPAYVDFVFFFYSISVLALYARCTSRGAMQKRQAMLFLRRKAMQVAKVDRVTRQWEEFRWLVPYGKSRLLSFVRRGVRFIARRVSRICSRSTMHHVSTTVTANPHE